MDPFTRGILSTQKKDTALELRRFCCAIATGSRMACGDYYGPYLSLIARHATTDLSTL